MQLARVNPNEIYASEFDAAKVAAARKVFEAAGLSHRVHITQKDLRQLNAERLFDQVLAIDVLEHIDDDELAMRQIADALKAGGRFVISVPTPNYPDHFGRDYADSIGHVRDGYWFEDMQDKLVRSGFAVRAHHYYTGRLASKAVEHYYGLGRPGAPYARQLAAPLLRPALFLADRWAGRDESSSLAVLAVKAAN